MALLPKFVTGKKLLQIQMHRRTRKEMFAALTKEATTRDRIFKRTIMGTGGGPPPNITESSSSPIEIQNIGTDSTILDMQETRDNVKSRVNETYFGNNRANLKRRPHNLLICKRKSETETKQTVSDKFKLLATEKMELLELQKELIKTQIQEEQQKADHNRILRVMDVEDAKKKYIHNQKLREMEMEETIRRNRFNEKMRQV